MTMTAKRRFLTALERKTSDRLPVTTHHVMSSFLDKTVHGMSTQEFFDAFNLDPIKWVAPVTLADGQYYDPEHPTALATLFGDVRRIASDQWRVYSEDLPGHEYPTTRYTYVTPKGKLTTVVQSNEHTTWVTEYVIKQKQDIDLIAEFLPVPSCDVAAVNRATEEYGERGLVRGAGFSFDLLYGQPGCWQDAACLVDIQELILATFDDPEWVHALLQVLLAKKKVFVQSLRGARYDLIELGGGAASSTVISPKLFDRFVAPYDSELIADFHAVGQRVVYHTCGGMMPILERVAAMHPDAMETFTPLGMGADVDLAKAKQRVGDKVCMIGGFDQFHFFVGCRPEETRAEVRRCFEAAGSGGGYILSPSDHFFEAEPALLHAFSDEAHRCTYSGE
jgi:uroporphyrinogen decarboxylase